MPPGESLQALWPRVWALASKEDTRSDGTAVWYIATQCGAEQLTAPAQAALADEALAEWIKWFAN